MANINNAMETQKNQPTQVIAAAQKNWKRARDFIAGEDAVKAGNYLSRRTNQTREDYLSMVDRTSFFAGAARTHECMVGLVTRKPAVTEWPERLDALFKTITIDGRSYEDLGEEAFSENMSVAFWAMLVDMPEASPNLRSIKDVERAKVTPRIATYDEKTILEVTPGLSNNVRTTVRARLLEDDGKTVRELFLDNGVYRYQIHRDVDGSWISDPVVTPTRKGEPLTTIPLFLVTPKYGNFNPVAGPLDHVIRSNLQHFKEECNAANSRFWSATPVPYILGADVPSDLRIAPDSFLSFKTHNKDNPVELGFLEFNGNGYSALKDACDERKDEMSKLGSNILASEKSAVEAAETHAIRRASENSVLAGLARVTSRKVEEALRFAAWWHGEEEKALKDISYALSTDFVPTPSTAQDVAAIMALWQAGAISRDRLWTMLQEGEILGEFDREAEAAEIDNEVSALDRPVVQPVAEPVE